LPVDSHSFDRFLKTTRPSPRCGATIPGASFNSMNRGIGNTGKQRPFKATAAGSGNEIGLCLSSPGNLSVLSTPT
jgi:hypothetical protein